MSRQDSPKHVLKRVINTYLQSSKPLHGPFGSALPAQQSELAWPVFVHDDPQRQGDGGQQEGAYGERQVQHLVLLFANKPAVHLQGPFGRDQRPHLHAVPEADHGVLALIVLVELAGRRRGRREGHVVAGGVAWKTASVI